MSAPAPSVPTTNILASASLYVGDLSPEVPESKLYEIFNNIGQVQSVRVLRDVNTRRSLGYAYVNFHRVDDAEKALEIMNFKNIGDRPCRIMWSQRNPDLRKSGKGNIFVKNLSPEIDNEVLRDTFTRFGTILSCKVAINAKGESLGYGFVHFANESDATQAVEQVNGNLIGRGTVYVAPFKSKAQRGGLGIYTNVYVKNLPRELTDEKVLEMFAKFGTVNSHKVIRTTDEAKTNYGFFNFEKSEEAKAAVEGLNNYQVGEKTLFVARAQKKEERERELKERFDQIKHEQQLKWVGVNLYIKNLSDNITDEKLLNMFSEFGKITSAKVMLDEKTKKSRGFGFVCFSDAAEAMRAVNMNGSMQDGKPLYVAMAQRSAERKAGIEQNMQRRKASQQAAIYPNGGFGPAMHSRGPMYGGQMMPHYQGGPPAHMGMPIPGGRPFHLVPSTGQGPRGPPRRGGRGSNRQQGGNMMRGGQQQGGQIKYNENARNRGQPAPQAVPTQAPQEAAQPDPQSMPIADFVKQVANVPDQKRKLLFGERLFPLVAEKQPELAPKITGMLLEMEDAEILELLGNPEALDLKIKEALTVLDEHTNDTQ